MSSTSVVGELRKVHEREIELKRLNGELACKECRRTKSGCDKKVPCTTCTDRDCADICPLGTLLEPNYERPVHPSGTCALKRRPSDNRAEKLLALYNRISVLEDALQVHSEGSHPLLADDLVRVKKVITGPEPEPEHTASDLDVTVKSFGTLCVGNNAIHYIGASSAEKAIREKVAGQRPLVHGQDFGSSLPVDLLQASLLFPFVPSCLAQPSTYVRIISLLPSYARATGLVEAYFTNLSWYGSCIDREQVSNELLSMFYPKRRPLHPSCFHEEHLHDLGLLYALFAVGAVADLTQPVINSEAEHLEKLARCALGMRNIYEYGSLSACQAMVILSAYETFTDRKRSEGSAWSLLSCGLQIGLSIGLHRDPSRWNLEPRLTQRRRWVFWQLNTTDKMTSLGAGHPPVLRSESIDCKMPDDILATRERSGFTVESIWRWRYRFTRDILTPLSELLCDARPVRYSRILELGAKLQAQEPHPYALYIPSSNSAGVPGSQAVSDDELHRTVHPVVSIWWKQTAIQRLHRNYFARAVIENPENPYDSIYAPSFLATFLSTRIILKLTLRSYECNNLVLLRLHSIWGTVVVSGIIVGIIACRVKVQACRDEAFGLLERLVTLFEGAPDHPIPSESLSTLKDLWQRGKKSYEVDSAPKPQELQSVRKLPDIKHTYRDVDEELLILSGSEARLVTRSPAERSRVDDACASRMSLLNTSSSLTPERSSPSSRTGALTQPGTDENRADKVTRDLECDAHTWLSEHEKDEAHIAYLILVGEKRCSVNREALEASGVKVDGAMFMHGPSQPDPYMLLGQDADSEHCPDPSASGQSDILLSPGEQPSGDSPIFERLRRELVASEIGKTFIESLSRELGMGELGLLGSGISIA